MRLLLTYLRDYWKLVVLALILATINQVFSLLDPAIFRHVVDTYATRPREYTAGQFAPRGQPLDGPASSFSPDLCQSRAP